MQSSSLVSVLIPTYNMASTLGRALQSVAQQDYAPLEVLVIDDGSTDKTASVVNQFQTQTNLPIRYLRHSTNQGKPAALNVGVTATRGSYLAILDADDMLPKQSIASRVYYLDNNLSDDAVFGDTLYLNAAGIPYHRRAPPPSASAAELARQFLSGSVTPFHPLSLLYRKEVFGQVGMFDHRLLRAEDTDFVWRLLTRTSVSYLPKDVYCYHQETRPRLLRMKYRMQTLHGRAMMIHKQVHGLEKLPLLAKIIGLDLLKLGYECFTAKKILSVPCSGAPAENMALPVEGLTHQQTTSS
ncbi:glycosyltransferase family 2 protein [Candidatus Woesearchaeota archaeon]|nr:glycosyltransferase family 2 protein [Candidatus Woesearchaeota archaeon]